MWILRNFTHLVLNKHLRLDENQFLFPLNLEVLILPPFLFSLGQNEMQIVRFQIG